jgi:hypothetical protein
MDVTVVAEEIVAVFLDPEQLEVTVVDSQAETVVVQGLEQSLPSQGPGWASQEW